MITLIKIGLSILSLYGSLQVADLATTVAHKVLDLFDRVCAYFKPNREVVVYGV